MSFKDVISVAADRIRARGMQEIPWSVLSEYASEANREFARRSEVVRAEAEVPLIADQRLYRIPQDVIRVNAVSIKYAGTTDYLHLPPVNEKNITDGVTRGGTSGYPDGWYLSKDRTRIGLVAVPALGGFDGLTTAGNTTTMTLETGASTADDTYNDMTVTILSGAAQGQTTTVSDYVGSTLVVTFDDTLTASVGAGARVQIGRETMNVEYTAKGNSYSIQALSTSVATAVGTPRYNSIPVTAGSYTPDYFKGCEVRFTDTTTTTILQGNKTRVLSSYGSVLTVFPELLTAPVNADAVEINSCPNTPDEYHHMLSHYVVARVLERIDRGASQAALMAFERGIEESKRLLQPIDGDEYPTLRGGYWDGD
jgi:hypothetical protein